MAPWEESGLLHREEIMPVIKIYMGHWVVQLPGWSGPRETKQKDHRKEIRE